VIVVLLHGGARIISGPHASEIAGRMYHNLYQRNYFADKDAGHSGTYAASSNPTVSAIDPPAASR
jgi:hypothetical protein